VAGAEQKEPSVDGVAVADLGGQDLL
jgi:hypothetical protein